MNWLKAYYLLGMAALAIAAAWIFVLWITSCADIGEYPIPAPSPYLESQR